MSHTNTAISSTKYQWRHSSVRTMEVMLFSLENSLNTVTVLRLPVYWKKTASTRLEAAAMELSATKIHFCAIVPRCDSFRKTGASAKRR